LSADCADRLATVPEAAGTAGGRARRVMVNFWFVDLISSSKTCEVVLFPAGGAFWRLTVIAYERHHLREQQRQPPRRDGS